MFIYLALISLYIVPCLANVILLLMNLGIYARKEAATHRVQHPTARQAASQRPLNMLFVPLFNIYLLCLQSTIYWRETHANNL